MQISKMLKTFSQKFAKLVECPSNCKHFGKKDDCSSVCVFEVTHCEKHLDANV